MKIIFYGTREYDHYYFDVLAADPEYGCEIRFLTANLDADTAPLAQGGDAVCAFVNADCSAPVLEKLAQVGIRCLLLRCAGYNNVDLAAAQKCGITVLRVPGYSPEAVAEHAMALAQAANRRICKAYIKVRNNNFALDGLLGYNLYGSSAGIVGTGRIGAAMARICHGFGMTVLAYDQYRNPALDGIVRYVELDELLRAWLCQATGYAGISLQPNAGSQGEYAGLLAIKGYHESRGEGHRNICLIPSSAHGTNPASAQMVGMQVVVTKCDDNGNVDMADLAAKNLPLQGDSLLGFDDFVKTYRENDPGAFAADTKPARIVASATGTPAAATGREEANAAIRAAFGK